nr:immunoglobulin heavy chain junction region [Mus musculus]
CTRDYDGDFDYW